MSKINTKHIADEAITLAKMADMATDSFIGRTIADAGVPGVLSKSDALTILNITDGANVRQDVNSTASSASFTPVFTTCDLVMDFITAQGEAITFNAPTNDAAGDRYYIDLIDDGTARVITFNALYKFGMANVTKPTTTTISKTMRMIFISDGTNMNCLSVDEEASPT